MSDFQDAFNQNNGRCRWWVSEWRRGKAEMGKQKAEMKWGRFDAFTS